MGDAAKSSGLGQAKDRLEASLERMNELVSEKNNAAMATIAITEERDHLQTRVEQLEALNAEHDADVAHQALHSGESEIDKKAIIKLRDQYEDLKRSQVGLLEELAAAKTQLVASEDVSEDTGVAEALKAENAALKDELANKIRQMNALDQEEQTDDLFQHGVRSQIDKLIVRVEKMAEQVNV